MRVAIRSAKSRAGSAVAERESRPERKKKSGMWTA
jgi:hypothetical protein